jgi:hypothetical protein
MIRHLPHHSGISDLRLQDMDDMQTSTVVLVDPAADPADQPSRDPEETWMMCSASNVERKVIMPIIVSPI